MDFQFIKPTRAAIANNEPRGRAFCSKPTGQAGSRWRRYEPRFETQGRRTPAKLSATAPPGNPGPKADPESGPFGGVEEAQAKPIFPDPVITLSWAAGWALLLMLHWPVWAPEA